MAGVVALPTFAQISGLISTSALMTDVQADQFSKNTLSTAGDSEGLVQGSLPIAPCPPHKSFPPAPKDLRIVESIHGLTVADPFRPLENSDARTTAWVGMQNEFTRKYLDGVPELEQMKARLRELFDFPRVDPPKRYGQKWFQDRNSGTDDFDVLYVMNSPEDPGRVLLDPDTLSEDGSISRSLSSISRQGEYLAYGISDSGGRGGIFQFLVI